MNTALWKDWTAVAELEISDVDLPRAVKWRYPLALRLGRYEDALAEVDRLPPEGFIAGNSARQAAA